MVALAAEAINVIVTIHMDTLSVVVAEQGSGCAQCIKVVRSGGRYCVAFRHRRRRRRGDGDGGIGAVDAGGARHGRFTD